MVYVCRIDIQQREGIQNLYISVSSGGTWEVITPAGWCPGSGDWDASDLVGRGGCLCYGGGPRHPEIMRLNEFKPFGYETYRLGRVGDGTGRFIRPAMPVGSSDFNWEIVDVRP